MDLKTRLIFLLTPLATSQKPNTHLSVGGVAEWLNAPVLKLYKNLFMHIHLLFLVMGVMVIIVFQQVCCQNAADFMVLF